MRRHLLLALALLLTLLAASPARADEPPMRDDTKAYLDRGLALYKAKDYAGAVAAFKIGYALEPRRVFLFAWAQAARLSGDCPGAIDLYKKFLAENPGPSETEAAHQNMARCEEALRLGGLTGEKPVNKPVEKPVDKPVDQPVDKPVDKPPVTHTEMRRGAWYKDTLGDALLGTGVAGLAVGGIFFGLSSSAKSSADSAKTYGDYSNDISSAQSKRTISLVSLGVGSALVVGAILRYSMRGSHEVTVEEHATLAPFTSGDRVGLAYGGTF